MPTLIRQDGAEIVAADFIIKGGKKLSTTGGGAVAGVNGAQTKTLTNNASNAIFTFPLASGEIESLHIRFHVLAKKGTAWAFVMAEYVCAAYNDGTTLQTIDGALGDTPSSETKNNAGGITASANQFTLALSAGIVTASYNPGNVGTSPDSIVMNYIVINPTGKTITSL